MDLRALTRVVAEVAEKWPGSTLESMIVGRRKTRLLFRVNGVRVKAILDPGKGRIRVFSPLKGVNIALTRMLERRLIHAEEPVQE